MLQNSDLYVAADAKYEPPVHVRAPDRHLELLMCPQRPPLLSLETQKPPPPLW